MSNKNSINIRISADELQGFCQKLLKRSRDISKTHDALMTLESFISIFGHPSQGTEEYQIIENTIHKITEYSREKLLKKYTLDLIAALKQCNASAIAAIHTPLPRNDFYQILQTAIEALSDDDIRLVMIWSANWIEEATRLAQEASDDSDDMDFNKADIPIEEFQAISDISRVLNPET